jgi:hypothetical protein
MRTLITNLALLLTCTATVALSAAGDEGGKPRCGCGTGEMRERLLARFDANKDGKLDDAERATAKAAMAKHREERCEKLKANHPELFKKIDTNQDGKIERGEMHEAREARKENGGGHCHKKTTGVTND